MDIDKYPEMVSGVDSIETYASSNEKGQQIVKSTCAPPTALARTTRNRAHAPRQPTDGATRPPRADEISALHMRFTYFVTHTYDPAQRCMVFHLDYDRKSDLDDTVGYWYVDQTGRSSSRVFYSCECTLRGWVPGPVYGMLTKEAVKKATTWVERESVKEYRASRSGFRFPSIPNNDAVKQFLDNMRETVASQVGNVKLPPLPLPPLPSMPQPPWQRKAAADWVDDRRRAASRFASSLRPPPKASGAL